MAEYNIKDLEKLSGILAHTIRIWEKRYNIFSPTRTATNRRKYSDDDLRRIINISILNRNGFKISKIAALSSNEIDEKVDYISQDLSQTDTQIESLIIAMIEFDESKFSEIITRSIVSKGFEDTFDNMVFPFLRRTGTLWTTGSIYPAQEHFISNVIRQKLIASIDSLSSFKSVESKKVLLYLPENELHELGLLYLKYLAIKGGNEALYLGQLTPFDSVVYAAEVWNPDIIVTGILSSFANIHNADYIDKLSSTFQGVTIILTGLLSSVKGISRSNTTIFQIQDGKQFVNLLNSGRK